MTLAEFRTQRDRRATEEAKRNWVHEVSDPDSLPEGMMRFTVYECGEPDLSVIIDRYLVPSSPVWRWPYSVKVSSEPAWKP
jgi:hypothetical protein